MVEITLGTVHVVVSIMGSKFRLARGYGKFVGVVGSATKEVWLTP